MKDERTLADDCLRLAEDRSHDITPAVRCALRLASDALRSQPSVEGWRPIETHDGSEAHVLIAEADGSVLEARLLDDGRGWWARNNDPTDHWGEECFPTHWQPLPEPPLQITALYEEKGG